MRGLTCLRFNRKSGEPKRFKQEIKYKFDSNRLRNVGDHFPGKGVLIGTDHTFIVCREKKKRSIKAYTGRECPFKEPKSAFVCLLTCLCVKHEGTAPASKFSPRSAVILFTQWGFKVYSSKRTRNKNEAEGTQAPHRIGFVS